MRMPHHTESISCRDQNNLYNNGSKIKMGISMPFRKESISCLDWNPNASSSLWGCANPTSYHKLMKHEKNKIHQSMESCGSPVMPLQRQSIGTTLPSILSSHPRRCFHLVPGQLFGKKLEHQQQQHDRLVTACATIATKLP